MASNVTLRTLKAEVPRWSWSAERCGWGWRYIGRLGDKQVTVSAVSVLCGPGEDDFATQWRVDDGATSRSYAGWWLEQGSK